MWNLGNTMPPTAWLGCGKGKKPLGKIPLLRISAGENLARSFQLTSSCRRTRTPVCTGLPLVIVALGCAWLVRS